MTVKFTKSTLFITLNLVCLLFFSTAHAKHVLIYGDSLSAAYGMRQEQGWVHLLGVALEDKYQMSNASISGETSAGGLARLPLEVTRPRPWLII